MRYRSILVHVDLSPHAAARILLAAWLAQQHGARLVGAAVGAMEPARPSANGSTHHTAETPASLAPPPAASGHAEAIEQFNRLLAPLGLNHQARLVAGPPDEALTLLSRFSDLVMLGQADADAPLDLGAATLAEHVIVRSGRPVFVVPAAGAPHTVGQRILLAWDGSTAVARAMSAALPMLRRAAHVTVVQLDAGPPQEHPPQPDRADLNAYLNLYDVRHELLVRSGVHAPGNALLSLATEFSCDLLVMGGYTQPPLRELLLAGTSRTVLRETHIPVLLVH